MATAMAFAADGVRWDLSALFSGLEDPKIHATWSSCLDRADRFASTYRGRVETAGLSPGDLASAIRELEEIENEAVKPVLYANLVFAADTSKPEHGAFLQEQTERSTELRVKTMFFALELQAAPEDYVRSALADPAMADYRHYVGVLRAYSPHRLSETEEVLLEETANTGCRAWQRLHEELTANQEYRYTNPHSGETSVLSQEEVLDLLHDPDRAVRIAACDSLSAGLKELNRPLVFLYNTLLADKKLEDRLRRFEHPETSRHMANELDKETVDLVMDLCRERGDLVERYYKVKREILGLEELTHADRYAPLQNAKRQASWDEAKQIVLDSFGSFSPAMKESAATFFEKNWIDAEPRPGKSGGAFCSGNTPDTHPVLLQSYQGSMSDVMTLAHEMGHGVHAHLSRHQTLYNHDGTLPLAELASIFGEMITFERLVSDADVGDRLALYGQKVEGIFASVHRQAAMFRFERRCHEKRRRDGELSPSDFGDIWQEEIQSMFGSSLKLGDQHRDWWSYVGHFIFAPFYVYAYSFGELLALSVYQMAKAEGPSFADKYVEVLSLGGSKNPHELMAIIGVDLRDRSFWERGFQAVEGLVSEFERIWAEYKKES
ncbi:MAG: M3 family oligoendopeptidase [Fimbriimonadaceae bacterium]|nr:M3 family oligoendopeptidase [Fimbriimonadaceae bacterium]QYK58494.1 MAG: M3 family oligoendopeptidase [Fimbriimonadaceae bacterium]